MLFETQWEIAQTIDAGVDPQKVRRTYDRKIQKLIRDSAYRKKFKREISPDHTVFE
jgi:cupin superfamily acireductone dioxygenase involved in methionine salvage